jgi:hypothetical protein
MGMSLHRLASLLVAAICLAGPAAAEGTDKDSDGAFTGIALITDDPRWYDLFAQPETPNISGKDEFAAGDRGALALVFSNAEARDGVVRVTCDVTAFDPSGSELIVNDGPCYEGPYNGDNILHPALLDLQFEIGPDDPTGRAGFEVTLRDAYSGRTVDLRVEFSQRGGE